MKDSTKRWLKIGEPSLTNSFVYIVKGERVVGYDNYEQKGDHRHYRGKEFPYKFLSLEKLWKDFVKDRDRFREEFHEG